MAHGFGSGGSLHDPSSVALFAMVREFLESAGSERHGRDMAEGFGCSDSNKNGFSEKKKALEMQHMLQRLATCADSFEANLLHSVREFLKSLPSEPVDRGTSASLSRGLVNRLVISRLQKLGYNAAICKTKWDHLGGVPAGDYEYIDVQFCRDGSQSNRPERAFVDIDFHLQFKIARPTEEFQRMWKLLPPTFVGRPDRLKRIVDIMSDAIKQSLKSMGLHLPPWRKPAYMSAKWFSSYKRTSNEESGRPSHNERLSNGNGNVDAGVWGSADRGNGLAIRYTNALEMLCHDVGRNAQLGRAYCHDAAMISSETMGDQITVITTDWQPPPAVEPRAVVPRKGRPRTGLSYLLLQGTTGIHNRPVLQVS